MVKDGSGVDDITKHDLELLVHANTETQKMFGDVLHAFELFTTTQKASMQDAKSSMQGAKILLAEIKTVATGVKDTLNSHETRCALCSDCVMKIKTGVIELKSSLFKYTCVIIGLSALLSVIINIIFKYVP